MTPLTRRSRVDLFRARFDNMITVGRGHAYRLVCLLVALAALLACPGSLSSASGPSEYDVKAAFIYNFAKFVDWPSSAFSDSSGPFVIGILGDDPFGKAIDEAVADKTVGNRRIEVRRYRDLGDLKHCQILFVSSSEKRRLSRVFDAIKNWNTLSVGETDGFTRGGGIVNFFLESNKLRFEVHVEHAKDSGLKISSKLLKLAKVV